MRPVIAWIKRRKAKAAKKHHAHPQHHAGHGKPAHGKGKGGAKGKKASARKIPHPKARTVAA